MSLRELASKAVMILEDGEVFTPGWKEEAEELANALRAALAEPQPEPVAAVGKRLIMVDETFDELMYWLDRCEDKGHLENCPDLIEPYGNFQYTTPPQRQPLTDEEIARLWSWSMTAEAERTANTQQHAFARAIERAHGIGSDK